MTHSFSCSLSSEQHGGMRKAISAGGFSRALRSGEPSTVDSRGGSCCKIANYTQIPVELIA